MIDAGAGIEAGSLHRRRLAPWIALGLCGAIADRRRGRSRPASASGRPRPVARATARRQACTAKPRGRRGRIRRPRSRRCATRAATCSHSARCTAAPSRWRSLTPTATRPVRWRGGRWRRRSDRCRARSARCWSIVSVNPRDTGASTRAAVRKWGLAGVAPWHWLRGTPRRARAGLARLPHLRRAAARRRHLAHRGAVPDRPPRRRALGLPVPVRAAVRDARPEDARNRAGGVANGRLGHRRRAHRPAARRSDRRDRGRGVARLRDVDQAADHVAAGADGGVRDGRRGRRRPGAAAAGRAGGRRRAVMRRRERAQPRARPRHRPPDGTEDGFSPGRRRPHLTGAGHGLRACAAGPLVRGAGRVRQPAGSGARALRRRLLRARVHALAEADDAPEHRDRRRGRRDPAARRMGCRERAHSASARRTCS